jgi:hypothetical protein
VSQRLTAFGGEPFGDLETTPLDQVSLVRRKEFVHHRASLRLQLRSLCMLAHIYMECPRPETSVKC